MTIDLNRATFRRLVNLYLVSIVLLFIAAAYEGLSPGYASFSTDFDALQAQHFGELGDNQIYLVLAAGLAAILAHAAACVGLLRFKPWGRWLFWASVLASAPFALVPGFEVYWTGFWTGWTTFLGSVLFGMLLLLAYSREHGALWFRKDASPMKEKPNG